MSGLVADPDAVLPQTLMETAQRTGDLDHVSRSGHSYSAAPDEVNDRHFCNTLKKPENKGKAPVYYYTEFDEEAFDLEVNVSTPPPLFPSALLSEDKVEF